MYLFCHISFGLGKGKKKKSITTFFLAFFMPPHDKIFHLN